jgi:hypothetical protein
MTTATIGFGRIDGAQCGTVTLADGTRLYVSYSTVVGIDSGASALFTDKRHSVTTSKQRTTKLYKAAGFDRVQVVPHTAFLEVCRAHGLTVHTNNYGVQDVTSPHSF